MGIALNLAAYAITLAFALFGRTVYPGIVWLGLVILINTLPIFFLQEGDPRLATLFPNTLAHLILFAVARGLRRLVKW